MCHSTTPSEKLPSFILLIRVSGVTFLLVVEHLSIYLAASLKTVFVDKPENILVLLKLAKEVPTLKRIVLTKKLSDEQEAEIRKKAQEAHIEIITYTQLRVGWSLASLPNGVHLFSSLGIGTIETRCSSCKNRIEGERKRAMLSFLATKSGWYLWNLLYKWHNGITQRRYADP